MKLSIAQLIPLSAMLLFAGLFALVVASKPRTKLRQIFSIYLFTMVSWSLSALMTLSLQEHILPWFRVMTAMPIAMMVAMVFFIQNLLGYRSRWILLVSLYGLVAVPLALFSPHIIESAYLNAAGVLEYHFGPLLVLVAGPGYLLTIVNLVILIRGYAQTDDANQRNRFRYLIIGLLITLLASLINFTEWGRYPLDVAANGLTAILIAYAILRHQLLDIRVVVRTGLLYSVVTAIFTALYFVIISLTVNLFPISSNVSILAIAVLVGVLTALILTPLRNYLQTWIDRFFYRERYNASLMLQRLSSTTAALLDLDKISTVILGEVTQTLHMDHLAIFVKHNRDENFTCIAQRGSNLTQPITFRKDHPIVRWLSRENRILTSNELNIMPIFRSMWGEERDILDEMQAELFVPLNIKDELVGFLVIGPKLSGQPYSNEDQLIFSTLGNQISIVVENARLYDELQDTFIQTITTLVHAIDMRDTYTSGHSNWIATRAVKIAQQLGCSDEEVQSVYWGGLLHDVGKIGIPDNILLKPGKLTNEEWQIIKSHCEMGARLVSTIKKLSHVGPLIECSHERYDGSGYPHGLVGDAIPLGARIIGVVDSFSAMQDERPYKKPFSFKKSLKEIIDNSGILYDPHVVRAFRKVILADDLQ